MEEKIISIINKITENEYKFINYDAEFRNDLDISSLEYFEIIVDIELNYDLDIPDDLLLFKEDMNFGEFIKSLNELKL